MFDALGGRVHAEVDWATGELRLWFYTRSDHGMSVMDPFLAVNEAGLVTWKYRMVKEGDVIGPPSIILPPCAKALQKALGEIGIESDSESKTKGKLEAAERHLEDMRALAFHALKTEKPEAK